MAPNSHIVKWLVSSYRGVLRKLRIKEARQASIACVEREQDPRMGNLESLENRVMLAAHTFNDLPKADYVNTPLMTDEIRGALVAGLGAFATKLESLSDADEFETDVPGVLQYDTVFPFDPPQAKKLTDILSAVNGTTLSDVIQDEIIDQVNGIVLGAPLTSLNFVAAGTAGSIFNPVEFTISANSAQLTHLSGDTYEVTFNIAVEVIDADTPNLFFDLGRNADQFGIRTTVPNLYQFPSFSNDIDLEAGLTVDFTAGVNVTITEGDFDGDADDPDTKVDVVNGNNDFFVRNANLAANADIDTAGDGEVHSAPNMQFGFLDVNLTLDKYELDGKINLSLNGGAQIPFASIGSITTSSTSSGTIEADVSVTVDDNAGFAANFSSGSPSYKIHFDGPPVLGAAVSSIPGSGDKRTAPKVTLSADAASRLAPYNHVTAGGVVAMLKSYAEKLGTLPASSVLNANLPLATGTTLGDLIPLGEIVSNHLVFNQTADPKSTGTKLVDSNGNPVFTSAQTFITALAGVLGVAAADIDAVINPTHNTGSGKNEIVFTIGVDLATAPSALTAAQAPINLDLDELEPFAGLEANALVTLTPSGSIGFTFGIDVAAVGTTPIVVAPPVQNSRIIGVVNGSGAVQTPANGQLSGNAVFKLSVGGSPNGDKSFSGGVATVTLLASATSTNGSVGDLVSDLQTAIDTALNKLDLNPQNPLQHLLPNPVSEPIPGHKLVKVDALPDGRLTLTSEFSSFLKLELFTGDAGGFAQLGFVHNQLATIAPTPWTGKLSGNATFSLRLGTGPLIPVSILQSATLDNSNFGDLLADIDGAVNAATAGKVRAEFLGGVTGAMILRVTSGDRLLQVVNPSLAVVRDLGWQDRQIHAEIQAVGRAELNARGGMVPGGDSSNGNPGANFSFNITIDGLDPVSVTVRQTKTDQNLSNTADNASVADLAADINLALGKLKLEDGRLLGSLISASAIDTNHDGEAKADTIEFRSTANIQSFHVSEAAALGIGAGGINGVRVGPTNGVLGNNATFTITVGGEAPQEITILATDTTDNNGAGKDPIAELVKDIENAIIALPGTLEDHVVVGRSGNHIIIAGPNIADQIIRITLNEGNLAGQTARDKLGFQDGQVGRASGNVEYFVENASAHLGVAVAATNASATGHVGFVDIDVGDVDASVSLDLEIGLLDNEAVANGQPGTRINIEDIDGRLTDIRVTGNTPLPDGSIGGTQVFKLKVNGGSEVTVSVPNTASTRNGVLLNIQSALDSALEAASVNARVRASLGVGGRLVLSVSSLQASQFEITVGSPNLGLVATGPLYSLLDPLTVEWTGTLDVNDVSIHTPIPGLESVTIPDIHLEAGDSLPGLASFIPDIPILDSIPQELENFLNLAFDNPLVAEGQRIVEALQDLADFFNGNFDALPFLGTKIPVINKSLADLLNVSDSFQKVVDAFKANPTDSIQGLRNRLIEALNLPTDPTDNPGDPVRVTYDAATSSLLLDLTFTKTFNNTLPIDFDLDLPFTLKGNAALEVDGGATAKLGIGINLTNPLSPVFFLNTHSDHTTFALEFAARGSGMSFNLSFGPAGLFINDGQLAIDGDGNPMTKNDPLSFNVTLSDDDGTADNRVAFTDIFADPDNLGIDASTVTGKLKATLPVFFPSDSDFLGNLGITINDLGGFLTNPTDTSLIELEGEDIIENLLGNISDFSILDNLPMLIDGVDFILAQLQTLLDEHLGSVNLPLVGGGLDDAAQFIANIRSQVFEKLRAQFTGAVQKTDAVITAALENVFDNVLGLLDPAGIDVTKQINGEADDFIEWRFGIGDMVTLGTPFDLGLPIFGLKSKDDITLGLNWHANIGFGIDFERGFYFIVDDAVNSPELTAGISIDLPTSITGNLLFFKLTADDKNAGADASLNFGLDIDSGGNDGKIGLGDLGGMNVSPTLTGNADLDLHLRAGINGGGIVSDKVVAALPSIVADFKLDAGFSLPVHDGNNAFTLSHVSLDNIGLDLGSFFSDFLSPLVQGIQDVTEPLQPFIDVFTSPIPVISDLAGQPVTLLDIAGLFGEVDPGMLEAVAKIITIINSIPDPAEVGDIIIPFGSITLVGGGAGDFNLFDTHAFDAVKNPNTPLSGRFGDAVSAFGSFSDAVDGAINSNGTPTAPDPEVSSFAKGLGDGSVADFIDFPILNDPSQVIGALFGRPFTLVTLDLPAFSFGFSYSQFFPIIGPLGASITGSLGASFDFAFGFDSFGLQKFAEGGFQHPLDIFRGFYVSDTAKADGTGADVNEVEITGSLVGAAELNLGVAKGSVGGGVKVTFGLNLNDPDHDGKVRIEELVNNLRYAEPPFNPLGIFDLGIKVEAFLTWAVEVLFVFKASGQIGPSLPILDLIIPLPHSSVLATDVGDGVLRLNTGAFAKDRLNNDVTDGNETITVRQTGSDTFLISGFGETDQEYSGFSRIEAFGGQGDDHFTFIDVTVPVSFDGGQGDDLIDFSQSSGPLTAVGGTGNDTLKGGGGTDVLSGNDGGDLILAGGNNDTVHGDGGNDTVSGEAGSDQIFGDADNDNLAGGDDSDFVSGGAGDDEIWGDRTFDTSGNLAPEGDPAVGGGDTLSGDAGKDTVHGNGGNDFIGGGAAADLIEGGLGADEIYGDSSYVHTVDPDTDAVSFVLTAPLPQTSGGDRIYGESEAASLDPAVGTDGGDTIHGEAGQDFIRGNSGNDSAYGDDGNDIMFGDQNDDRLEGGDGGDIIFGGAHNDTVLGQAASDVLFGDDGLVVYFGFPSFEGYLGDDMDATDTDRLIGDGDPDQRDEFTGTADSDPLSRDFFATDVRDSDGNDYVDGAAGNDTAFGGRGNDVVIGDADPTVDPFDPSTTATGNDLLFGDGGKVQYSGRIITVAATIAPFDLGGNDTMYGNNGDDIEFGGPGNDAMNGGHGTAFSTSGSDKDVLVGDNGQVDFVGGKISVIKTTDPTNADGGSDTVNGNEDKDVILGGVAGDALNGNLEDDIIVGDEGQLDYNLGGPDFDGDIATLDRIQTTFFTLGGNDTITGADHDDIALGGTGDDNIKGDAPLDDPGDDTLIGDQGTITFFAGNVTHIITTDVVDADGGVDTINGNEGDDVILGGVKGDLLKGNDDNDIILGDEGQLQYNLSGGLNQDGDPLTVDNIETLQPNLGGIDTVEGDAGDDVGFGGAVGDHVYGDADSPLAALDGEDMLFGDGGRVSLRNGVVWKLESTDTNIGGNDTMEGNAGSDIMLGGAQSDQMHGDAADVGSLNATLDGDDTMLGDNGLLNWLYTGDAALAATLEAGFVFDSNIATLDLITTIAPNHGDDDMLFGNAGSDVMLGGTNSDLLVGDNTMGAPGSEAFGAVSTRPGSDLEFGDHGRVYPQHSFLPSFPSRNFFSVDIGFTSGGAGDSIFGNEMDDVQIGGQGDDQMFGNSGDDDMVGGHNVSTVTGSEVAIDEFEKPIGTTVNDFMDGGTGDDAMAGDNATIWRNGSALQANDLRLRIRTLNGSLLYVNGLPNITAGGHNDPLTATTRSVFLLDHSAAIETADLGSLVGSRYGNDVMAGNANDDAIFGQLGADMIQGDGKIVESNLDILIYEGVRPDGTVTDGNDYIEGNGGDDMLIGNLGQDDIIGGSSQLFGLTSGALRPDGGDIIFGGAATPQRVERHAFTGDVTGDQTAFGANLVRRHATDSDFIMGDNSDIYRIVTDAGPGGVGGATTFVQFNYDKTSAFENRGDLRIVVRAYNMLDYSPIESNTTSIGDRDVVRGESGDDFIHGMTGGDILYGDAENDEIFGERDKDWISGGTGDDAMLGDNGFILTSRNSIAEPLYGVIPTTQVYVSTPGNFLQQLMNPNGRLKHAVDLEPFDQGNDDVMYGGLGSDDMHGGQGNDGMSGAEALPDFYNSPETSPRVVVGDIAGDRSTELRILPIDGNGVHNPNFYDFVNALPKLTDHFLNFENDASLKDTIGILGVGGGHWDANNGDGRDNLFGDWGDDWLVGGTGRDHLFGGMGNDIVNLDDDLETNGGANDQPDNGNLIPGPTGGPAQVYDNVDIAYGGGGRDVLILNTGGDRAEDWVGEYNSFIAPFAPFGNGQVERQVPPSTYEFFYLLGESDGADQTRLGNLDVPTGAVGTAARRGEPFGELGLVTQKDKLAPFDWASQNGAPIDNQAGNTPGGMRDTRGDGLNGGTTNTSAVSTETFVEDIPIDEVVELSFTYWAESISGLIDVTLDWVFSTDPMLAGESLIDALKLKTLLSGDEYEWVIVPV